MKRFLIYIFWISLLLIAWKGVARAQYSIVTVPPPPSFVFNDLWHFTVIRNHADKYSGFYISLRIMGNDNLTKVKSNSSVVSLPLGSSYYNTSNLSDLQPFSTSYPDGSLLQQVISSGGIFPAGNYVLGYTLFGKSSDGEFIPLAENATQITVEAMWPPMLLEPGDKDTIDTPYPLLSWTPAFTGSFTGPVTYKLRLTELFSGQTPIQAMLSNPAYFAQAGIVTTALPYPPTAQPLNTGKTYVWQISADAGGSFLGTSEIWSFTRILPQPIVEQFQEKPFIELSREGSSYVVEVNDGMLRLAFEERLHDADRPLIFSIYDSKGKLVADQKQLTRSVREGHNKIRISLCDNATGFNLPKGYYSIEVLSRQNDIYRLHFHNNKNITPCADL